MSKAVSVRLDDDALRALAELMASGLSRSEAIHRALVDAAARLRHRPSIAEEVKALEADPEDRREMVAVASLMRSSRVPG